MDHDEAKAACKLRLPAVDGRVTVLVAPGCRTWGLDTTGNDRAGATKELDIAPAGIGARSGLAACNDVPSPRTGDGQLLLSPPASPFRNGSSDEF